MLSGITLENHTKTQKELWVCVCVCLCVCVCVYSTIFYLLYAGQFFRQGVRIDRENQILYIPQREPIPVIRRPLWSFMRHSLAEETECWTSMLPSNQGVGLIDGTWTDYKVKGLIAN